MRFIVRTSKIEPMQGEDAGGQRRLTLALRYPTKTVAAAKRLLRDGYWLTYSNCMFKMITQFEISNLGYVQGQVDPIVGTDQFEEDLELTVFDSIIEHFSFLSLDGSLHDFEALISASMILFRQYPLSLQKWYDKLLEIDNLAGRPLVFNKNNDLESQISLTDFLLENRDDILAGNFANILVNQLHYNPIVMHFDHDYDDLPVFIKAFSAIAARVKISVVYLKSKNTNRSLFDIVQPLNLRIIRHDTNNGKLLFFL